MNQLIESEVMTSSLQALTEKNIQILEKEMLKHEQADCPVVHRFGPNLYIREVTIDAGVFSIGHYQKTEHLNIMISGRVTMFHEDGSRTELIAPQVFVSQPGRKIGYIHEKMVWQNVYSTSETDIEKLEELYLDKSGTWDQHQNDKTLFIRSDHLEDVEDYHLAIAEFGFDHQTVRQQTENTADQIPMPYGNYKMQIADSVIDGKGVFATGNIESGEVIAPALLEAQRTPVGRYTNHSKTPNAMMVLKGNNNADLVAIKPIKGCQGGNLGEEITVNYRQVLGLSLRRIECQE
ncbi:SET domain-containing protein-lysine N-methyltransferase [Polynucleobacter asymbioticus]|jgi:hypothetical protein|uniref:SET domain-containing protein n=1 Tax=Polynucleobacter asymbioticus TaxID=576611 RepID=A0AAC9NGE0_9BURK|nr:SET domain-containing protein-lysine N-methyltransferase [Polynucleobacter asymbioticus]APB99013.1 hypothetical protein A4F89_06575 [Polynucleobacter asymbioticus]APC01315.1 hypothetical protein AOC25_06675 [Polynucleobacter asymbioticus]